MEPYEVGLGEFEKLAAFVFTEGHGLVNGFEKEFLVHKVGIRLSLQLFLDAL